MGNLYYLMIIKLLYVSKFERTEEIKVKRNEPGKIPGSLL